MTERCSHDLGWHMTDWSDFALNLRIDGPPAVLKNSKRIVRMGARYSLVSSARAQSYLALATAQLRAQWARVFSAPLPLACPVNARILIYMPSRRHCDLSNAYQAPEDALERAGVLTNDCQIHGHDGSRKRHDKGHPRVEITLTPMRGEP